MDTERQLIEAAMAAADAAGFTDHADRRLYTHGYVRGYAEGHTAGIEAGKVVVDRLAKQAEAIIDGLAA